MTDLARSGPLRIREAVLPEPAVLLRPAEDPAKGSLGGSAKGLVLRRLEQLEQRPGGAYVVGAWAAVGVRPFPVRVLAFREPVPRAFGGLEIPQVSGALVHGDPAEHDLARAEDPRAPAADTDRLAHVTLWRLHGELPVRHLTGRMEVALVARQQVVLEEGRDAAGGGLRIIGIPPAFKRVIDRGDAATGPNGGCPGEPVHACLQMLPVRVPRRPRFELPERVRLPLPSGSGYGLGRLRCSDLDQALPLEVVANEGVQVADAHIHGVFAVTTFSAALRNILALFGMPEVVADLVVELGRAAERLDLPA